jgi:hypothetical protein
MIWCGLASLRLSLAADFPPSGAIFQTMVWIAPLAWAVTFAGFLASCRRSGVTFVRRANP